MALRVIVKIYGRLKFLWRKHGFLTPALRRLLCEFCVVPKLTKEIFRQTSGLSEQVHKILLSKLEHYGIRDNAGCQVCHFFIFFHFFSFFSALSFIFIFLTILSFFHFFHFFLSFFFIFFFNFFFNFSGSEITGRNSQFVTRFLCFATRNLAILTNLRLNK